MTDFRVEHVKWAMAREQVENIAPSTIDTNIGLIKGGVILPDVEYAWDYFFGIGRGGRGRLDAHEGPQTFHGSIPVTLVQFNESRDILEMILGSLTGDALENKAANATITYAPTTLTDSAEDFTSPDRKDGTHAVYAGNTVGYIGTDVGGGITELTVYPTPDRAAPAGWNGPIPVSGASGDGYEIRLTTGSGVSKSSVDVGFTAGDKFIVQLQRLQTMTWGAQIRGSNGQSNMVINYIGGKVNRATLSARSGQKLQLSLDDVIFQDLVHDINLPSASVAKAGTVITPTPVHPTEEPLVFTQGTIALFEMENTFARILSFSLVIDQQLTEGQYISTKTVNGVTVISQIPNELTEGTRIITLEVEALLDNRQYWEHLMRQGQNDALTAKTGFDIKLQFQPDQAGNENLFIMSPAGPDPVEIILIDPAANTEQASATNVGALLEAAPHSIPAETESLIPVRMRFNLPNLVIQFDDA